MSRRGLKPIELACTLPLQRMARLSWPGQGDGDNYRVERVQGSVVHLRVRQRLQRRSRYQQQPADAHGPVHTPYTYTLCTMFALHAQYYTGWAKTVNNCVYITRGVARNLYWGGWIGLDWIEQGLTSPPTQYRLYGEV